MQSKPWYASKTMWFNILAGVALYVQSKFGFVLSSDEQAGIILVVNIVLRAVTKGAVTIS